MGFKGCVEARGRERGRASKRKEKMVYDNNNLMVINV